MYSADDGQVERTIQTLDDMIRVCVIDSKGSWYDHRRLINSTDNTIYHSNINMAPYGHCMGVDVDILFVGLKKGKQPW